MLKHVAHNSEGHVVDKLLKALYNSEAKRHEIEVRWRGLSNEEDSWVPADTLLQDVPAAVRAFVKNNHKQSEVRALRKALQIK
ncbi:Chromo (CHRromatin Organization MOdifier) domain [Phytophthora infestans]|uniref:Chromo (CHRromatin Organization MOdifier) domain n=1 Tax=Phytophthora infestans TaxID=4787 RepID=A0A8S9TSQ1_PHYIN|nr:Chromo (CHRromatin Organization MOdifier) domain [Phytophthora infestans]